MRCCAFLLAMCVVFAPATRAESVSQTEMLLTETFGNRRGRRVAGGLAAGWRELVSHPGASPR